MTELEVLARIESQRVVPVVRASTPDVAVSICKRLIGLGLDVIELTTTIPNWWEVMSRLDREEHAATIGMGTITTAEHAQRACDQGADFLVSPYPAPDAKGVAYENQRLFIGGGFTPAEIAAASAGGLCKLFPAHVGGRKYLRSLKAIFPNSRIMPTGGVTISDAADWLAAGAFAVGLGSDLYAAHDLDSAVAGLRADLARVGAQK